MTDKTPIEDTAWRMILAQVELFQNHMRGLGIQHVKDHYSCSENDTFDGLQGSIFTNGCMTAVDLFDCDMPHSFDMITLVESNEDPDQKYEIEVLNHQPCRSIPTVAEQIFSNIIEFAYSTGDEDLLKHSLDLKIETNGGIVVEIIGEPSRTWQQPELTDTAAQLNSWFERQVQNLVDEASDRFSAVAKTMLHKISEEHEGLDLEMIGANGSLFFDAILEGEDNIDLRRMNSEDMEERWPGLSDDLEEIVDLFNGLESGVNIGGCDRIRTAKEEPEPEVDDGMEP